MFCYRRKAPRLRAEQPSVYLEEEYTMRYQLLTPAKALFALQSSCGHLEMLGVKHLRVAHSVRKHRRMTSVGQTTPGSHFLRSSFALCKICLGRQHYCQASCILGPSQNALGGSFCFCLEPSPVVPALQGPTARRVNVPSPAA